MGLDDGLFGVAWIGVSVLIGFGFLIVIAGIVVVTLLIVVNVRRARARGHDPLTLQTDLASRLLESELLAPSRGKTDRLAELDRLLVAGTITPTEHAAGRAAVLGS